MGTKHPKVSAYVPQVLKDRLDKFIKERNDIPESQAVNIILAEYFGMTEVLGRSPQGGGGVTLARMEALEKRLADFSELVERRLQEFREVIEGFSGLPMNRQVAYSEPPVSEQDDGLSSELNSGLDKDDLELQGETDVIEDKLPKTDDLQGKQNGEPPSNLPSESLTGSTNHTQISLILGVEESEKYSIRIDGDLLARRIRLTAGSLKNKRSKLSDQEFTEWTTTKDDDGIGWKGVKEGKRLYYEPAMPIKDELLSKLLEWIKKNRK